MRQQRKKQHGEKEKQVLCGRRGILYRNIATLLILTLLVCMFPADAKAASLSLRYNGKTVKYTKSQTKISIDGKNIPLKGGPGVIIDNTNMVPYTDVFDKGLGADTSYSSATKELVIRYYNNTLEMKRNSKTAYLNGKKITLDAAPKSIYFSTTKKSKLCVPAGSVATALGCKYVWNNGALTGQITTPYIIKMDGKWVAYNGTKGKVTYNNKKINVDTCPSIIKDSTALLSAAKVFKVGLGADYSYDSSTKQITISQNNTQIVMKTGSKKATVNGVSKTLATAPRVIAVKSTGKSYVMVPGEFVAKNLGYDYKWNSSTGTSVLSKKQDVFFQHLWDGDALSVDYDVNMITALKAYTNHMSDYLSFSSRFPITPNITQDLANSCIYVDIPGIYNGMDTVNESVSSAGYMTQVSMSAYEMGVRLTIFVKPDTGYYTMTSNDTTTLVLCENNNTEATYQMKIPMADNVLFSSIKTADYYENNYFTVEIPGDWISYFTENPIVFNSEQVSDVTYTLNALGNTIVKVTTYELQGFRLNEGDGFIGINIGAPSEIYKNIVILDAGHGGSDPGTSNSKAKEKDLTLKIIYSLAEKYFNSPDSPVKAYWTRTEDKAVSLNDRAALADKLGADLFISLHMNSATNTSAKGLEVLYANKNSYYLGDANSKVIAKKYADYLVSTLEMKGRTYTTVDRPNLVVLYKNTVPAILIELGFISNSSDYKKIANPEFQETTAKAIYDTTVSLFEEHPTNR